MSSDLESEHISGLADEERVDDTSSSGSRDEFVPFSEDFGHELAAS